MHALIGFALIIGYAAQVVHKDYPCRSLEGDVFGKCVGLYYCDEYNGGWEAGTQENKRDHFPYFVKILFPLLIILLLIGNQDCLIK